MFMTCRTREPGMGLSPLLLSIGAGDETQHIARAGLHPAPPRPALPVPTPQLPDRGRDQLWAGAAGLEQSWCV